MAMGHAPGYTDKQSEAAHSVPPPAGQLAALNLNIAFYVVMS